MSDQTARSSDDIQRGGFDVGGGWYAKRGSDGSVSIYVPEPGERTFTPQQWASLVAAVSILGEGHATYLSALGFHGPVDDQMNRSSVNAS